MNPMRVVRGVSRARVMADPGKPPKASKGDTHDRYMKRYKQSRRQGDDESADIYKAMAENAARKTKSTHKARTEKHKKEGTGIKTGKHKSDEDIHRIKGGKTRRNKSSGGDIVTHLLTIRNQVKLYHWQTGSFARHKATDDLTAALDLNIDAFVESYMLSLIHI